MILKFQYYALIILRLDINNVLIGVQSGNISIKPQHL